MSEPEELTSFLSANPSQEQGVPLADYLESMLAKGIEAQIQYGQDIFDWTSMDTYGGVITLSGEKDGEPYSVIFAPGDWSVRRHENKSYLVLDVKDPETLEQKSECVLITSRGSSPFLPVSNKVLSGVCVLRDKIAIPVQKEYDGTLDVSLSYDIKEDFAHLTCWYEPGFEPDMVQLADIERNIRAYIDGAVGLHDFEVLDFMEFCEESENGDEFGLEFKVKL